jgi:hypothetical protein
MRELDRLEFLLGSWKGRAENQFGEKGILEETLNCTHEPSEHFLQLKGENRKNGKLLNKAVMFITYDSGIGKYVCKRIWSMGFVENGVGGWKDPDTLQFQIKFDSEPAFFRGTLWRSFIRRYSDDEISTGLYTAKKGQRYKLYGEAKFHRVKT